LSILSRNFERNITILKMIGKAAHYEQKEFRNINR